MKRLLATFLSVLLCFSLMSCAGFEALKYSITGEIIEPAEGFYAGEEKGTLIYNNAKYISLREISGDCDIMITEDDILLGRSSNFPFFPDSLYYVKPDDNSFIIGSTLHMLGTFVYLREDIFERGIVYTLNDGSYEFEFESAFIRTDEVDFDRDIKGKEHVKCAVIDFHVKDIPSIRAKRNVYLIDGVWYSADGDITYRLSDELARRIKEV